MVQTLSGYRIDLSPNDAVMFAVVSLETGDVDIATEAVDNPAATVTDAGVATAGLSLVNAI